MGKIISFVNQKGGVGKTTSAVNVAACLGVLGYRTLLIDLDPQGNATTGVKIAKKNLKYTVCDLLTGNINAADAVIQTEYDKLWVMPANGRLANTEFELYNGEEPVFVMRKALESLKTVFDYIIVDCPPSLGMLTVNSLTASDGVVVPMQCEFYALEGLSQLSKTIRTVHDNYNSTLNSKTNIASVEETAGRLGLMKVDPSQITYIRLGESGALVRRESTVRQWTDFLYTGAVNILGTVR